MAKWWSEQVHKEDQDIRAATEYLNLDNRDVYRAILHSKITLSYKLPEHIEKHYNKCWESWTAKATLANANEDLRELRALFDVTATVMPAVQLFDVRVASKGPSSKARPTAWLGYTGKRRAVDISEIPVLPPADVAIDHSKQIRVWTPDPFEFLYSSHMYIVIYSLL
jgi:hypothetical protein